MTWLSSLSSKKVTTSLKIRGMQCNKGLETAMDPSPKNALGAHKMAAQLRRRPPWPNTELLYLEICYVMCIMWCPHTDYELLLCMFIERGHSWLRAPLDVGMAAIRAAIMNLLACDVFTCYPVRRMLCNVWLEHDARL